MSSGAASLESAPVIPRGARVHIRGAPLGVATRAVQASVLVGALFFFLFGVRFTFMPTYTSRMIVIFAALCLLGILLLRTRLRVNRDSQVVGLLYLALLSWVMFRTGLDGAADPSILNSVLLMSLHSLVGGLFFALWLRRFDWDFDHLVLCIHATIAIQAVFILLYFVSWEFRAFAIAYIPAEGNIDYTENLFQSRGLTHSSGSRLSLIQSLGLLFTAYLAAAAKRVDGRTIYLLITFGLIAISVFLTGRTGLLMVPVVLVYLFAVVLLKARLRRSVLVFAIGLPVAAVLIYLLLRWGYVHVLGGFTTASGEDGFDRMLRWVTSEFFHDGRVQSLTVEALWTRHWFWPEDWRVFLYGDPKTWSVNRISSDTGFIRILFGIGLVGILLTYTLYVATMYFCVLRATGLEAKLMLMALGAFMMVTEAKEPYLTDLNVNAIIVLLLCHLVVLRRTTHLVMRANPASESAHAYFRPIR